MHQPRRPGWSKRPAERRPALAHRAGDEQPLDHHEAKEEEHGQHKVALGLLLRRDLGLALHGVHRGALHLDLGLHALGAPAPLRMPPTGRSVCAPRVTVPAAVWVAKRRAMRCQPAGSIRLTMRASRASIASS